MKEIIETIKAFNNERDWDQFHSPENLVKSISIEAAELLECFQWSPHYKLKDVEDEIADVLIYTLTLCGKLGIDPYQVIESKINRNRERFEISKTLERNKELKHEDPN